jgi:ribosomal protein S18 acetylase RimI-like enzyme
MRLTIRRAEARDADDVAAVQVASWHATYRGLMPDRLLDDFTVEVRGPRWREILGAAEPAGVTWIAVGEDDRARGFASTGPARDSDLDAARTAELLALYVAPDLVGQGAGRLLMDHALADLRAKGFADVVLWVLDGNARAERFYRLAGLAPGRREVKVVDGANLPHTRFRRDL